jgi:hypothetical protein
MTYPYSELLPQLQIELTPDEYQKLTNNKASVPPKHDKLAPLLPTYSFAECPFCHTRFTDQFDTYHLPLRFNPYELEGASLWHPIDKPCPHFYGVHSFLHLHHHEPSEVDALTYYGYDSLAIGLDMGAGEVPYLTDWLISDKMESYATIHALPICRPEDEQFVPTYTLFILTYFSESPGILYADYIAKITKVIPGEDCDGWTGGYSLVGRSVITSISYDLNAYAHRGRLGWLDYTQSDLPLAIAADQDLPAIYRNIEGMRHGYSWRKGKFR